MSRRLPQVPHSTYAERPAYPVDRKCVLCPLHATVVRNVCIGGFHVALSREPGPNTPAVVVLGQNPGYNEDLEALPFIGDSGHVLHNAYLGACAPAFNDLASIYVSNVVQCSTPSNTLPNWRSSIGPCFAAHTLPLLQSIVCSHLTIFALGAPAADATLRLLTGTKKKIAQESAFKLNATLVESPLLGRPFTFVATYHPAYFLRFPNVLHEIKHHINQLHMHLLGLTPVVSRPHVVEPFAPPRE